MNLSTDVVLRGSDAESAAVVRFAVDLRRRTPGAIVIQRSALRRAFRKAGSEGLRG